MRPDGGLEVEIAGDVDAKLLLTGGLLRALSRRVGVTGSTFEVVTSGSMMLFGGLLHGSRAASPRDRRA